MMRLAFTCGDINGIGPEICVKAFNKIYSSKKRTILFFCPQKVFYSTLKIVKPEFEFIVTKKNIPADGGNKVVVVDIGNYESKYGIPTKESGQASFKSIYYAVDHVKQNFADALITAPISKTAFTKAKIDFPGHTELLALLTNSKKYQMFFISRQMKAALATIHEPIGRVPKLITKARIKTSIEILQLSLIYDFKIAKPKIALLGLNPHAGEEGKIGKEEVDVIRPMIEEFANVEGPFAPDAFFGKHLYKNFDAVLGMYHDQVLIPFKMFNFSKGVNFTAGLPIIRTSPDHGTGYDIAGKGIANAESIIEAVKWAELIFRNRNS